MSFFVPLRITIITYKNTFILVQSFLLNVILMYIL
nr:MAG TPA: hypothetical protein [Caudoviricetes sp.]